MRYEEPKNISKEEAAVIFLGNDTHRIREALVATALHESDWRWVQEKCLLLSSHADSSVRAVAATCLGHLARIHGQLDLDRVMSRLEALLLDAETVGYAETALDDIKMFVR